MSDTMNAISTLLGVCMDLIILMIYLKKQNLNISKQKQICVYSVYEAVTVAMILLKTPFFIRIVVIILAIAILLRCFYKVIDIYTISKLIAVYFIILGVGELATVACLMMLVNQFSVNIFLENWELWLVSTLMAKIISLIFIVVIERFWTNESEKLNGYERTLTLVPLIATFIVLYTIISLLVNFDSFKIVDIMRILVLISITMAIYTLVSVASMTFYVGYKKKVNENEVLKMKNNMQYKIYEERLENDIEIRKIAHDIKNHLYCIENTIQSDDEMKQKYIYKLKKRMEQAENRVITQNDILDILIKGKCEEMSNLNINYDININFAEGSFIEEIDIVVLFGNLIDNAIEACAKIYTSDKIISIHADRIENFLAIKITNSTNNGFEIRNGELHTTKENELMHGMGLINIKKVVEKYEGKYTYQILKDHYVTNILIPIPTLDN